MNWLICSTKPSLLTDDSASRPDATRYGRSVGQLLLILLNRTTRYGLLFLFLAPLVGCGRSTSKQPSEQATVTGNVEHFLATYAGMPLEKNKEKTPSQITNFEFLFSHNCAGCHGETGKIGVAPPLNDPLFLAIASDAQITQVASAGRPSTLMPGFAQAHGGSLTEKQVKIVVNGIRHRWGKPPASLPPKLPPYTVAISAETGDSQAGKQLFQKVCARCHGQDGRGGSAEAAGALNNLAFLALISDQALRRYIITGRPDLGMPNFVDLGQESALKRPLTSEEITQIVTYMRSWAKNSPEPKTATEN